MTSDPKTKPEEQETVGDETSETPNSYPKSGKLTLEELASVSGGDGDGDDDDDSAWFNSPGPWDP